MVLTLQEQTRACNLRSTEGVCAGSFESAASISTQADRPPTTSVGTARKCNG